MKDLIAKLEAATEGSRDLDMEIEVFCSPPNSFTKGPDGWQVNRRGTALTPAWEPFYLQNLPRYTTSLDAAMTLVPEGWSWSGGKSGTNNFAHAELFPPNHNVAADGDVIMVMEEKPVPLLICIAALRVREAL